MRFVARLAIALPFLLLAPVRLTHAQQPTAPQVDQGFWNELNCSSMVTQQDRQACRLSPPSQAREPDLSVRALPPENPSYQRIVPAGGGHT
jgi:hypothetical protein